MKAIVTGGAGFIGSHLVDALIDRGDQVWVIDNLSTGKLENRNPKAKFIISDIRYHYLYDHFRHLSIDYIFHLAALPKIQYSFDHPKETNEVNIIGTLKIIEMAAKLNVKRLIYSSSSSIYGDQLTWPLREDMPVNPLNPYALQKFAAERYCQMLFPNSVCLRYFNVYGSRQSSSGSYSAVIGNFLSNHKKGAVSVIYGDGEQTRDFTWVGDVVRANILASESNKVGCGEVINIGGGKNYSVNQLKKMIGGLYHYQMARKGESRHTLADITKAKKLLGWEPYVSLEEGIAELKKLHGLT